MATNIHVKARELRAEVVRGRAPAKVAYPQPFWFTGNASTTAFSLPQGWSVHQVFSAGLLKRPGASEDYTVATALGVATVTFGAAPSSGADICIMGVRT